MIIIKIPVMTNMYIDYMNIKTSNLSNSSNEMGQPFKCIERYKKVKKKNCKAFCDSMFTAGFMRTK